MYRRWLLKGFTLINGWLASAVRDRPARPVARIQLLGRHPDQLPVGLNQRPRRAQVLGLPDLAHPTLVSVAPTSSCAWSPAHVLPPGRKCREEGEAARFSRAHLRIPGLTRTTC